MGGSASCGRAGALSARHRYQGYRSDETKETWREATPLRIDSHRGRLLRVAHWRLRDAERPFRVDHMSDTRPSACRSAAAGRPLKLGGHRAQRLASLRLGRGPAIVAGA